MSLAIRDALPADRPWALLHSSAETFLDALAGGRGPALELMREAYLRDGTPESREQCRVACVDGELAGVLAGFPAQRAEALAGRFATLALGRRAPWRWPRMIGLLRAAGRVAVAPPPDAFYVDGLAVAPAHRRCGVAGALLRDAEVRAGAGGHTVMALDTALDNAPARALYEGAGFELADERQASPADARRHGWPGMALYVKAL